MKAKTPMSSYVNPRSPQFQHVQPVTFTAGCNKNRPGAAYRRHVVKGDTKAERRETAERRRRVDEAKCVGGGHGE